MYPELSLANLSAMSQERVELSRRDREPLKQSRPLGGLLLLLVVVVTAITCCPSWASFKC